MKFKTVYLALLLFSFSVSTGATTLTEEPILEANQSLEQTERYIIEIEGGYNEELLEDLGAEIHHEYDLIDDLTVEIPDAQVSEIEELPFVEEMHKDEETFLPVMDAEEQEERAQSFESENDQVIAVLDTGVDDGHIDLEDEVVDHRDFTGSDIQDRRGHGTHVAGIAAGTGEADSRFTGVSPESSVMNVKVLRDDGSGRMSYAIRGIEYAVNNNADVIVMSLGTEVKCDGEDPLSRAADKAIMEGIPTVASAGNAGPDPQTITSPGCGKEVLTVGASGSGNVASFSSRGSTHDGRVKPDLVAPGTNIVAPQTGTRSSYVSKSGTSMSAPYIAGGIAVLQSEVEADPEDYFEALTETSYSLGQDSNSQGSGNVNLTAALNYLEGENRTSETRTPRERTEASERLSLWQRILTFLNGIF